MNQEWFEMLDIRKRFYDTAVWVPLRAVLTFYRRGIRIYRIQERVLWAGSWLFH